MTIQVYQIQLTDEQIDMINKNGHDSVPAQVAHLRTSFYGSKKFKTEDLQYYTKTMEVDTDDLEEAFALTNLWNDPSKVTRIGERQSSMSVGNIVRKGDSFYMVDNFGFGHIPLFEDEVELLEAV